MIPPSPTTGRPRFLAWFSLNRKAASLYLALCVIVGTWLLNLLTLSRMKLAATTTLSQLVQHASLMTVVSFGVILLLLKLQGEGLASVGLAREKWRSSLLPGVLFGLGAAALELFVLMPLARRCWPNSQGAPLNHWFEGPAVIPLWLVLVCQAGAKEELERTFILTRFEQAFGRTGLLFALILGSIMFGIGHLYQGKVGAVVTGIVGFLYALIYLRRRSCWEAAIAHATYDAILVALAIVILRGNVTHQ